jgi:hypothetical protein
LTDEEREVLTMVVNLREGLEVSEAIGPTLRALASQGRLHVEVYELPLPGYCALRVEGFIPTELGRLALRVDAIARNLFGG